MAKLTFVGGIHPYDGKDLSKDKPIQDVLPKGVWTYKEMDFGLIGEHYAPIREQLLKLWNRK